MSAPPPFGYLFAGIAVADLAAEIDWFSRLFGRPPDILPNADEAMWGATESGSVYLVRRPERAGHAHVTLAVNDSVWWDYALYKGISTAAPDWQHVLRLNVKF